MRSTAESTPETQPVSAAQQFSDAQLREVIAEFSEMMSSSRARWSRIASEIKPELNGGALILLHKIMRYGACNATELGQHFDMDKAMVSRQVAKLRELGFIETQQDETDKRVQKLSPTQLAHDTLQAIYERSTEEYRARFAGWSHTEVDTLVQLLHRFNTSEN